MIKASECRVGNKLIFQFAPDQKPKIVTVSWVSDDSLGYYEQHEASYPQSPKSFTGIPLTPEILEKCGFEKDRNGWQMPGTQFSLTEQLYPCWLDRMLWPQDIPDFKRLSLIHLHQLQNLYFALTGEELNVQL